MSIENTEKDIPAGRNERCGENERLQPKGTVTRGSVSKMEIRCECYGKRKEDIKLSDSYAITAMMLRIQGWQKTDEREIQTIYGRQRLYKRI